MMNIYVGGGGNDSIAHVERREEYSKGFQHQQTTVEVLLCQVIIVLVVMGDGICMYLSHW